MSGPLLGKTVPKPDWDSLRRAGGLADRDIQIFRRIRTSDGKSDYQPMSQLELTAAGMAYVLDFKGTAVLVRMDDQGKFTKVPGPKVVNLYEEVLDTANGKPYFKQLFPGEKSTQPTFEFRGGVWVPSSGKTQNSVQKNL